jgi:voltage-gated potassium channel
VTTESQRYKVGLAASSYVGERLAAWRAKTSGALFVLAVGSVPILLLDFKLDELPLGDRRFVLVVNIFVLVAFLVDYLVGLSLAKSKRQFVTNEKLSGLIVLASAVALVPTVAWLGSLKLLRLAPVLRALVVLLRLAAAGGVAAREARQTAKKRALRTGLLATFLVWISAASSFTIAEDVGINGRYESFFDALWWAATTITTVGYGDIVPVTTVGRMVGVFCMTLGIAMFGLLTARLAALLVSDD